MSKILIVSHQFLPHQSPRTTRWKMIYDELNTRGHEVMVLTGTPQEEIKENIIYVMQNLPRKKLYLYICVNKKEDFYRRTKEECS